MNPMDTLIRFSLSHGQTSKNEEANFFECSFPFKLNLQFVETLLKRLYDTPETAQQFQTKMTYIKQKEQSKKGMTFALFSWNRQAGWVEILNLHPDAFTLFVQTKNQLENAKGRIPLTSKAVRIKLKVFGVYFHGIQIRLVEQNVKLDLQPIIQNRSKGVYNSNFNQKRSRSTVILPAAPKKKIFLTP